MVGISLREQIELYRKKYHRLEVYRGVLLFIAVLLISSSILAVGEYFLYLNSTIKTVLFFIWLGVLLYFFWSVVVRPSLSLLIGFKALSDRQIAVRMGKASPGVEDKIINILELEGDKSIPSEYLQNLVVQRTAQLSGENLFQSINRAQLVKAAWIAGIPTVLIFTYAAFDAQSLQEGSSRFFNYSTAYTPKAPFEFVSKSQWTVERGSKLDIELSFKGEKIPSAAHVYIDNERLPMRKLENGNFLWTINRVTNSEKIQFEAMDFISDVREIVVLDVPSLLSFDISVIPPSYTRISPFELTGSGDALIPEGSNVIWKMNWAYADAVMLQFDDTIQSSSKTGDDFIYNQKIYRDSKYRVLGENEVGTTFRSGQYALNVLSDKRPTATASWNVDSVTGMLFVRGNASDDYGVARVQLKFETEGSEASTVVVEGRPSNFSKAIVVDKQWSRFSIEVIDNDAIRGGKKTVLGPYDIGLPTESERREEMQNRDRERVENLEKFRENQERAREQREDLQQRMIEGTSEWKRNQMRQQMQNQQQELMNQWEEMKRSFEQQNEERMLQNPEDSELAQKREELQRLLDSMNTDKLDELLREMEREGEEMNDDKLRDWMRRVEQQNERMELDAERIEELMKRLNFEQNLNQALEDLEDLQQRQEELANREDDTQEEQEQLNEEFEQLMQDLEDLEKEDQELKRPNGFESPKEKGEETEESMQESSEQLEQGEPQKANDKQQQSSQSMQEMMEQMSKSIMSMQMEMHVENLENLRRILTNLIHLSEDQEVLLQESNEDNASDAVVVDWMKRQQDLRKGYQVVDDSLSALITRIPQLDAVVTEWLVMAKSEMEQANEKMSERQMQMAGADMRESMLSLNELAVMLDGAMDQMQQQMAGMMQSDQTCERPGQGQPSSSNMRRRQQELNEAMKEMGQQKGSGEGEGQESRQQNSGEGGQGENGRMSQEIVDMMRRQSEIRDMLKQSGSTGNNGDLDELLKENERDLARRNFDSEFWERQKEIEVKMLELEEAERQQEQDEQRRSTTGDRYQELRDEYMEEFIRKNQSRKEELRFEAPLLTPYYRARSSSYLRGR
ncbi:DUF4175 family protein [Phaeocystidibacter luteus]|uniref:DUF4175 domain-containing protein n=1 Tax=Phaeocystidibacter luteus TaxID=911197 RepID=A0A6N6RGC0_9FLAO|nr:DUF4175 family protein [Phaeocystidibacter luteus]KAB2810138.1 hypothetical protein F8C67_07850 [Phaeocystidibacter luteus]